MISKDNGTSSHNASAIINNNKLSGLYLDDLSCRRLFKQCNQVLLRPCNPDGRAKYKTIIKSSISSRGNVMCISRNLAKVALYLYWHSRLHTMTLCHKVWPARQDVTFDCKLAFTCYHSTLLLVEWF